MSGDTVLLTTTMTSTTPLPLGLARPPCHREGTRQAPSARELAVLIGMSYGNDNKVIARRLGLSSQTVRSHAASLYRKLGAVDRAHAVRLGFELGLLGATQPADPDSPGEEPEPGMEIQLPGLQPATGRDHAFQDRHIAACFAAEACPCRYPQRPHPPSHNPTRQEITA